MKKVARALMILFPVVACAQSDSVSYFDKSWKRTVKDSASFYRITEQRGSLFHVRDFYLSGILQMEGDYSSLNPEIQEGYFTWYFDNGQKFVEGNFLHGQREGVWTFWYPDGLKKQEVKFLPGKQEEYVYKWRSRREKNSVELIEKAVLKMKRGKSKAAEELLNTAISNNPYSVDAYYQRGLLKCANYGKGTGCEDLIKAKRFGFLNNALINSALEECCLP